MVAALQNVSQYGALEHSSQDAAEDARQHSLVVDGAVGTIVAAAAELVAFGFDGGAPLRYLAGLLLQRDDLLRRFDQRGCGRINLPDNPFVFREGVFRASL
jgi:hypothetical protein